jgi:hypothetical protein
MCLPSDDPIYYREKALHCLALAASAQRADVAAALRELAAEFEQQSGNCATGVDLPANAESLGHIG